MNGGVQNRLLTAFPPIHINQVVWSELIPKEKGEAGDSRTWLEARAHRLFVPGSSGLQVTVCGRSGD